MATLRKKYHGLGNKINNALLFIGSVKKDLGKRNDLELECVIKDCEVAEQELLELGRQLDVVKSITFRSIDPDKNVSEVVEEGLRNNRNIRLLFVDDEIQLCELLERSYSAKGFQVQTASNAAEARKKILGFSPHMMILDLYLDTGMEGLDILRFVRKERSDIKCLIASREFDEGRLQEIKVLGVEGILKKPIMADELEARINGLAAVLGN